MTAAPILEVRHLSVSFPTQAGLVRAVDDVSFEIKRGETFGVVGESGSGKSVTFMTIMGLISDQDAEIGGEVLLDGQNLLEMGRAELRAVQGERIAMVFQDPLTALNPLHRVGRQIAETFRVHRGASRHESMEEAIGLLDLVGIPQPRERSRQYPHEFSGGMRQRVTIAMALALDPDLLIADESTTALDVTVQAQILDLIDRLKERVGAAVVMVTHDLGIVAEHCDDVMVMYAGRVAELGALRDIFYRPQHPYTWGLLSSVMRIDAPPTERLSSIVGQPPSLIAPPSGCRFNPRCPHRMPICVEQVPALTTTSDRPSQDVACHLPEEERRRHAPSQAEAAR